ncbi:MAG: hypothetical protein GX913_06970 [Clostridiales bacterium]|nr:hypothetical protein [Clostridiales bacterium]
MKKVIIYSCLALWVVFVIHLLVNEGGQKEIEIVEALNQSQLQNVEGTIEFIDKYKENYLSLEEKEELLKRIAAKLGVNSVYELETVREEEITTTTLLKNAKAAVTTLKLSTVESRDEENQIKLEQYLVIQLVIEESYESILYYRDRLEEILQEEKIDGRVTLGITGYYPGEISYTERNEIADKMLEQFEAKVVLENRTMELYSIYAYSDLIDEYIVVARDRINLNLAMSYNEVKDATKLYISIPIIDNEY